MSAHTGLARQRMAPAPPLPPVGRAARKTRTQGGMAPRRANVDAPSRARAHLGHVQKLAALHRTFLARQAESAARLALKRRLPQEYPEPDGLKLGRREIEEIATGKRTFSSLFGPMFACQDAHRHQIRIPAPPMTIVDCITGIEGEPDSMVGGAIWSETDVTADSWGLDPSGRVSTFVLCEAGQASMLLASWLGADRTHAGDLRYRLVDFQSDVLGPFPKIGERICAAVRLERVANVAGRQLFFFTAELRVAEEIRARSHFTAGLFRDGEPADAENGDPSLHRRAEGEIRLPARITRRRSFSRAELEAFAEGRMLRCFGEGFERMSAHVRTPRVANPDLFLLDTVPAFDPHGGPSKRGYLRAEQAISPDAWYFAGKRCLPESLLVEAGIQCLAFYLTAAGATRWRDGWRFEPVPDHPLDCRFREQITPQSARLVFEVSVESLVCDPQPRIVAEVLCGIEGRPVFHARLALTMVPDWPLEQFRHLPYSEAMLGRAEPLATLTGLAGYFNDGTPAAVVDGRIESSLPALLALGCGRAQDAFGPRFAACDRFARWPRLPVPPFLFLTRITNTGAEASTPRPGSFVESEYDIPAAAWYFSENGAGSMPLAVLLETVLQPCRWLFAYTSPPGSMENMRLRNLDGGATVYEEARAGASPMTVRVEIASSSQVNGAQIHTFSARGFVAGRRVIESQATFASFVSEDREPETPAAPAGGNCIDLTTRPARYFECAPRLPGPMLLMIQRVAAFDPAGGQAGLGWVRAEKDVDPGEWFFKANCFQDPAQPGSLCLESLLQLLQFLMIEKGLGEDIPQARFELILRGRPITWNRCGDVTPESKRIVAEIEVVEIGRDAEGAFVVARGWLRVDGVRIYGAENFGMRIVAGGTV
ncbi:MAG: hypothetical protein LAO79_02790 [Acidobacteriia bacterium]|nr:hypothetical protein [Terriglobia bacterium]